MVTAKSKPVAAGPPEAHLTELLGRSRAGWDELVAGIEHAHPPVTREWHFTPKTGTWHLRLKQKTRTILYLLPREKYFLTAFVFGDRALVEVLAGDFPSEVKTALNAAPRYAEGTGIRLVTRNRRDVAVMLRLAAIKLAS